MISAGRTWMPSRRGEPRITARKQCRVHRQGNGQVGCHSDEPTGSSTWPHVIEATQRPNLPPLKPDVTYRCRSALAVEASEIAAVLLIQRAIKPERHDRVEQLGFITLLQFIQHEGL